MWKSIFSLGCVLLLLAVFFSYQLLEVPPGITEDEAAIGYNAVLLSKTAHDENNRLLPFFVLSNHGVDWHQPVTIYITAAFFKIFTPSYLALKLVSVFFLLISIVLLFYLLYQMDGLKFVFFGSLIFITTPIMMIQSHLAIENIALIPFELLWLIGAYKFLMTKKAIFLILAGVSLGIGFYSYKAMRLIVPLYVILTFGFLTWEKIHKYNRFLFSFKSLKEAFFLTLPFTLSLLPFIIAVPFLETKYPGAVLDKKGLEFITYYDFFYGFLANLDFSFLFIKGDNTFYHSTGRHGALLLASVPLFLIGIFQIIKKRNHFLMLVLLSFFFTPFFFGVVGSVFRASRLLAYVPLYSIITGFGALFLWENKTSINLNKFKISLLGLILVLVVINFADFVQYYFGGYKSFSKEYFKNDSHQSYEFLSQISKKNNLKPYVEEGIYQSDGLAADFFNAAYFDNKLGRWKNEFPLPPKSVLMSSADHLDGMRQISANSNKFKLFVSQ